MSEIAFIIDELNGTLLVEDAPDLNLGIREQLTTYLGTAQEMGCARPLVVLPPEEGSAEENSEGVCVRIAGYYHNSLCEGPGRRSSVLFQSCPLRCKGCWVTHLHSEDAGELVPVPRLAAELLDPNYERDGISILGGEPFAQPDGLLALVKELRQKGCRHILCYSGYTFEALCEKGTKQKSISAVLNEMDILIDGVYVESLAGDAGEWTGSGNQRVIDLQATRKRGEIVIF
jgi:anaerobic ribonucleoside-triphosphate reductase activating protein